MDEFSLDLILVGRFTQVERQHVVLAQHRQVDLVERQQQQRMQQQMEIKRYAMTKLNELKKFSNELNESNYWNKNESGKEKKTWCPKTKKYRGVFFFYFQKKTYRSVG